MRIERNVAATCLFGGAGYWRKLSEILYRGAYNCPAMGSAGGGVNGGALGAQVAQWRNAAGGEMAASARWRGAYARHAARHSFDLA